MCTSKIVDCSILKWQKTQNCKTACWYSLFFPNERWAEMTWTVKRDNQLCAPLKQKVIQKALSISKYARFSLLCYVARSKEKGHVSRGGAHFQIKSWREKLLSPGESSDLRPSLLLDLSFLFDSFSVSSARRWLWKHQLIKFTGSCFELLQNDEETVLGGYEGLRGVFTKSDSCLHWRRWTLAGCELCCVSFRDHLISVPYNVFIMNPQSLSWFKVSSQWAKKEAFLCTYFCTECAPDVLMCIQVILVNLWSYQIQLEKANPRQKGNNDIWECHRSITDQNL